MNLKIPNKHYFRIGEVSDITGIKPHVLRYWESEFPALKPPKSKSKQRLYRKQDIETVLLLKKLLYQEGYTILGAQSRLKRARFEAKKIGAQKDLLSAPGQMKKDPFQETKKEDLRDLLLVARKELVELQDFLHTLEQDQEVQPAGNA